jgi:hypothetical protein
VVEEYVWFSLAACAGKSFYRPSPYIMYRRKNETFYEDLPFPQSTQITNKVNECVEDIERI